MNKEERAENWFRNIPGEEKIPMEKKIELCGRVTIPIILICLGIFIAEYALLRFFACIDCCDYDVSVCYFAGYREYALPAELAA